MQFKQVFFGLMTLSLLSAFALPQHATELNGTFLQTLLIPISRPAFKITNGIRGRFESQPVLDTRDTRAIEQENLALKQQIQNMSSIIQQLQQRANERASLGGFESFCDRFEVTGADTDVRDAITITGSGVGNLRVDPQVPVPVLSSGASIALIGRISHVGSLAAQVRLITDPGFTVTAHFINYSATSGAQENKDLTAIVTGKGAGNMVIDNLAIADVRNAQIQLNDWVVLSDETWPQNIQGVRIGQIGSIQPLAKQPLFAHIELVPELNLEHLPDVWVMTHQR